MNRNEGLAEVLSEFARTLLTDFPIQSILDHLVVRIDEVMPITSAGVTLISPDTDPHFVAASNEAALRFERLQTESCQGYYFARPMSADDLDTQMADRALGGTLYLPGSSNSSSPEGAARPVPSVPSA